MITIDRKMALHVCGNLKSFYNRLVKLYSEEGIDLTDDLGRRNILMSGPMEHFLAEEIGKHYDVTADGRTGKADIVVHLDSGLDFEVECKLTSPHKSSGSISFQTDYETLLKKQKLDYVYLVASADFQSFCFIHFEGLTIEDFRGLSPGARGKVQMYKYNGMPKANVLVGTVINREQKQVEKLSNALALMLSDEEAKKAVDKVYNLHEKIKIVKNRNPTYSIICEEIK